MDTLTKELPPIVVKPQPVPSQGMVSLWEHYESVGAHMSVFAFEPCVCWCSERHPYEGYLGEVSSVVFWTPGG